MGWLDDIERSFVYKCECCGSETAYTMMTSAHDQEKIEASGLCEHCDKSALVYVRFETESMNILHRTKESFEKNGRLAYKIGNSYISKTKYDYLESGKIENQYTSAFKEKLRTEDEYLLRSEASRRRGRVSKASPRFATN